MEDKTHVADPARHATQAGQASPEPMGPGGQILNAITWFFDIIYRLLLEYSKVVLLVLVFIICAQVFSRRILDTSIRWSEEVALVLMVWMAFISMAIGVQQKLHISIVMFFDRLSSKTQYIVTKINLAITCGFGMVLVVYGYRLVKLTMSSTLPATQWPAATLYVMMPVSGVFIVYFTLFDFFGLQRYFHKNIESGSDDDA